MKSKQKNKCAKCGEETTGYVCQSCFDKLAIHILGLIAEKDEISQEFWTSVNGKYN